MATALLEQQEVKQPKAAEAERVPSEYRWTVDTFMKASDAGVFGHEARLELIQGRIVQVMGQSPRHSALASTIADMLREAVEKQFAVREEKPIRIASDSEPIPDIAIVNGQQTDYNGHHPIPDDVRLLVEVSVTTVEYDLGEKALLYAQSGIADYWVVLVNESAIVRHRQPSPEGYQDVVRLTGTDALSPPAMPSAAWTIDVLLGRKE